MNERIRELAMQTDRECEHLGQSDIGEDWVAKFAQLIVRECIHIVEKNKPQECQRRENPTDFIEGWEVNSEVVIEQLMLNFDIEDMDMNEPVAVE